MHHSINTSLLQNQPQLGMINNETDQDGGSVNNIKLENQLNSQQSMQSLKDIDAIKNKATNFIAEQLNLIQTKFEVPVPSPQHKDATNDKPKPLVKQM